MSQIQSGDSTDLLKVGAVSKAARVELYDALGNPINPAKDGKFFTALEVVPTTLTVGTVYFGMRNNSGTKKAVIDLINLNLTFSGIAAATRSAFELVRFSGANLSGGVVQQAAKSDNLLDANTIVTDIRSAVGGLTITGTSFESAQMYKISIANQLTANINSDLDLTSPIILAPGEGLAIRANTAIVLGAGLFGTIGWTERN